MATLNSRCLRLLKEIADNLTLGDVGSIKFVCRGETVGAAALDRISNHEPLKLLKILHEKQIIDCENLTWLRRILKEIGRNDLMKKIPDEYCIPVDDLDSPANVPLSPVPLNIPPSSPSISPYRLKLKGIADQLTYQNISEMKFLLDVPDGISERLDSGERFLTHMEGIGKLSENDYSHLKGLLSDVNRRDLVKMIDNVSLNNETPPLPIARNPDLCYSMASRPHGFALIINIQHFKKKVTNDGVMLGERRGSHIDLANLKELWKKMGFNVEAHLNLKAHQIFNVLRDMSDKINLEGSVDCFVCCIMTHGSMGKLYGHDGETLDIKDIIGFFKEQRCVGLKDKPKLFFIQACRGTRLLRPASTTASVNSLMKDNATPPMAMSMQESSQSLEASNQIGGLDADAHPSDNCDDDELNDATFRNSADLNEPHFFLGYSTAPGHVSFRCINEGTWYMKALTSVLNQHYLREDLVSMMVQVNHQVTQEQAMDGYKQCPVPALTLVKKIFF